MILQLGRRETEAERGQMTIYSFIHGFYARPGAGTAHKEAIERCFFQGSFQPRGELLGGAEVSLPLSTSGHSLKCGEVSLELGWSSCDDIYGLLSNSSGLWALLTYISIYLVLLPTPGGRYSSLFVGKKIGSHSSSLGDPEFKSGLSDSFFF